ncbi:MAG: hypothetical protein WD669_12230 [Pirellulales bacterium]
MSDQSIERQTTTALPDRLPEEFRRLFWDHDFDKVSGINHYDFVVGRILVEGDWNSIQWLRKHVGDDALRDWIERHEGRGLSRQQLRFWELILKLPAPEVDRWLAARSPGWDDRIQR